MENGTKLQNYIQIQRKETVIRSLSPLVFKYLASPKEKPASLHPKLPAGNSFKLSNRAW